jgi:hypothetical protein
MALKSIEINLCGYLRKLYKTIDAENEHGTEKKRTANATCVRSANNTYKA